MRIINKHYAQLLIGYDRVLEFSQKFDEDWSTRCRAWENNNQQKLNEYGQQYLNWQKEKKLAEDRYTRAYQAWFFSETPTREVYERNLVLWKKRWEKIFQKYDAQLQTARSKQKTYQTPLLVSALLSILIVPAIVTFPAAVVFAFLYFKARRAAQALAYRRNAIHAIPEPTYRPLTPAPQKPDVRPEPVRPKKVTIPVIKPMLEAWWEHLPKTPSGVHNVKQIKEGDEGEALLVQELMRVLSDEFITIPGAMVEPGTDADVVVIGKNGIWVLDSKYYAGTVRYSPRKGWSHDKEIFVKGGGGTKQVIPIPVGDLSDEWERERSSVDFTLKKRMHRPHPPVVGGIAFTYNAELKIVDPPLTYGTTSDWSKQIASIPCDPKFTERDLVECAHHILNFSHTLIHDNTASAVEIANALRDEYYKKIETVFGK